MELERVKQVLAALRREGVAYKVFGGVALNLHGLPRFTHAIRGVWAFGTRTLRPHFPPGLHRHRSFEEAQAAAEAWERERFAARRRLAR